MIGKLLRVFYVLLKTIDTLDATQYVFIYICFKIYAIVIENLKILLAQIQLV